MYLVRTGTRYKRLIEPFEEMYLANLSTRQIASLLDVAKSKVAKVIKEISISRERLKARKIAQPNQKTGPRYKVMSSRYSRSIARDIYQEHYGIILYTKDAVHHKDGDCFNNDISNLELMSRSEHQSYHMVLRKMKNAAP